MIAFIHIEKAAGTTINHVLRRSFGIFHCDVEPWDQRAPFFGAEDFARLSKLYPRLRSIAGHAVMPHSDLEAACPGIQYFTFLREPLSRTVSHYQNNIELCGYDLDLGEWLGHAIHKNFQTKRLGGGDTARDAIDTLRRKVCFVGLLERFDESMVMLRKFLGAGDLRIRYTAENITRDREFKTRIMSSPERLRLLENSNLQDRALYEYVTAELYPEQARRYGPSLADDVRDFRHRNGLSLTEKLPGYMNMVFRHCIYKPALRLYRKHHRLPIKRWPRG